MRRLATLALLLACTGSLRAQATPAPVVNPTRVGLAAFADSLLDAPMFRSAQWGVLIVDPTRGDTLYSRNAGKLFVPASNTKLVTAAVTLAQLGSDYRYTTRVLGRPPRAGTIAGDLVVVGSGDPTVSDSISGNAMLPLLALADSLHARGVRRITGALASGANAFPGDTLGLGWAWDDLDDGYAAPVDELLFNEGFARVTVVGGARPGAPVSVRTAPAATLPQLGRIDVVTERNCCMLRSRVTAAYDLRGPRPLLTLAGTVRAGDSVTVAVALRAPNTAFLEAFHEALRGRGIEVVGGVRADSLADTTGLVTLATRVSPPLPSVITAFQKPSQNQIGEILLRTLGREKTGVGTADSGLAVVRRQLAAWGIDSSLAVLRDGSGLSRHNFLAPEAIVRLLDLMRQRPDFDVYYQALPVAGVDGTIRERTRGTLAAANARAKTGTLDKARALSGYVTTADGQVLLFSMIANNHTVPTREVERVQDALLAWLAGMSFRLR
ncbi:D-alanyl-D-alanine carboxypeptidase/D-alanyl-D-alanine-endopeptidase [Pseudogemmatithrix spongiicola]|uniref:D-alanyl-D-alanine carboxypeptidase/D-alanyl-D-alanine-endopeptidase n=1 Tax=Pseudogemmatithrix spongiicola TaxID=3062599 RepID=A0AA49JVV5_9BACT|nr:D-alanyl-D-alanine carboxypeptidase/D-alanyl-D-alanine-endopeptidase [Gemmatimonadaceae bacterium 'strain 138']WKW15876.1 D-alanyl-D-alanine carboxypeptidase/D-alanyl-D-alanine-endopeptidase [Gemmatimonadaceae bacterium 'strain 318']